MSVDVPSESSQELHEQLRFESLIADISSRFVNVPAERVDWEIENALHAMAVCLRVEQSSVWQALTENPGRLVLTHIFRDPALPPAPKYMDGNEYFPWCRSKVLAKEIIYFPDTQELPPEAARDMETWRQFGVKSVLAIPLSAGGGPVFGALSFDATQESRSYPESLIKRCQLIAEVFANAIERGRAEQSLGKSEARLSLAADSANAGLWTLDPRTNQLWATDKTYEHFGLAPGSETDFGVFFAMIDVEDREKVRQAIEGAMQSGKDSAVEYRIHRRDGTMRWISSRGRRQAGTDLEGDRLMGASIDITESKRVETELAQLRERLQVESDYLKEEIEFHGRFAQMIGESAAMNKVFSRIEQVAHTDSTVLIMGETGTGKELIARAIHSLSQRKDRVLVKVDCSALPATLIESELFGREQGAYTGALTKQIGRI